MLGLLLGNTRMLLGGPLAICGVIAGIVAICGCMKCLKCRLRDCGCCKRLLRCLGHDEFDDFDLMILVHEANFESRDKLNVVVQVTAGSHVVKTDPCAGGMFQQPVHIFVEQGTHDVTVDLLDNKGRILATLELEVMGHILAEHSLQPEMVYSMKQKGKGISKPKIKLTMVASMQGDAEKGLLTDMDMDVDILVRQQLKKAKQEGIEHGQEGLSELDVLKAACAGPLELFEGLGKTRNVYVAVIGPPIAKRYVLGIWGSQNDYEHKKNAMQEIELLKIELVQGDPTRHHVFVVKCFDEARVRQTLTFRRIDRARDVWVELLHLLVMKAREQKKALKASSFAKGSQSFSHGKAEPASKSFRKTHR